MDNSSGGNSAAQTVTFPGVSWVAYAKIGLLGLVALIVSVILMNASFFAGAVVAVLGGSLVLYKVLYVRSIKLYCDQAGVWVYAGVLPWAKGTRGVKWRDLSEALMYTSFSSWIFKSYNIHIGHRFTKSSEIRLTDMHMGHETVANINQRHAALAASNQLQ